MQELVLFSYGTNLCLFCTLESTSFPRKIILYMKCLIFLTGGYPFGNNETFIENEIEFLAESFHKIFILVPGKLNKTSKRDTPKNTVIITPKKENQVFCRLGALCSKTFWQAFYSDIRRTDKKVSQITIFRNCWHYFSRALNLYKELKRLFKIYRLSPGEIVIYSYWLDEKSLAGILLKRNIPGVKVVSRAHRWDIYEEMQPSSFLPFRPFLYKNLDLLSIISKEGLNYLSNKFPELKKDIITLDYLGTLPIKKVEDKQEKKSFTIISCSRVIPRKRLELISNAIRFIEFPIHWIHVGGGPQLEKLKAETRDLLRGKENISVNFMGDLTNQQVKNLLAKQEVDLFISVSVSEGIPVSIMEAQSAGIPSLATAVGGVVEIVIEGTTGWLLPGNPTPEEIAKKIKKIRALSIEEMIEFKRNSLNHWRNNFNAELNFPAFAEKIKNL